MLTEFQQAVLAEPPILLKRQLLPFSIGHYFLLDALNSPFIESGQVTLADCLLLIGVCSRNFMDAVAFVQSLSDPTTKQLFASWGTDCGVVNVAELAKTIELYLKHFGSAPDFWEEDDSKPARLPLCLVLTTALMGKLHFNHDAAWNFPLGQAIWYAVATAEDAGERVVTDDEASLLEKAKGL